jgi:hypothetical protein
MNLETVLFRQTPIPNSISTQIIYPEFHHSPACAFPSDPLPGQVTHRSWFRHGEYERKVYSINCNYQQKQLILYGQSMKDNSSTKAISIFQEHHGMLHTQKAITLGISPRTLYQLRNEGMLICESRGLFRLADTEISTHHDIVQVALRNHVG